MAGAARARPRPFLWAGALVLLAVAALALGLAAAPARWRADPAGTMRRGAERVVNKLHLKWLAGALGLAGAASSQAATPAPVPPTKIGVNISAARYWNSRIFANLAISGEWTLPMRTGRTALDPGEMTDDGNPLGLKGYYAQMLLVAPTTGPAGSDFRCTFDGKGDLTVGGKGITNVFGRRGNLTFHWVSDIRQPQQAMLRLNRSEPADPVRNIDCRETSLAASQRFAPGFLDVVKKFGVLRFMDLQNTNENEPVTWATRNTQQSLDIFHADGVAVEDLVAIANAAGADAWFTIPWNADDDYVERFAHYVHDHLPPERTVYAELSNEIWNWSFRVSRQANDEGIQRGYGSGPPLTILYRQAERHSEVMKIWSRVFADRPNRLVRVIATQNVSGTAADTILSYKDTAKSVDALATAPYFTGDVTKEMHAAGPNAIYAAMPAWVDGAIAQALRNKQVASKYGKQYVAYEAGQHLMMPDDVPLLVSIQRDQRMYDMYRAYLTKWRQSVGNTIMLYSTVRPIGRSGAFGMMEYEGQPLTEAPKMRATLEEIGRK